MHQSVFLSLQQGCTHTKRIIWVNMLLVDKFLSTGIWSTDYCRKIFVDTTLRRQAFCRNFFVDTTFRRQTFRRHDTSSKFLCRHKHAEIEELLRVLNFFKFHTIQLLNLGSEGEGDNYKTTSGKVRVKVKIFKLDHTK